MSHPLHDLPLSQHSQYLASVTAKLDGNLILPHTIESGDPYYIGDVYEETLPDCVLEWEIDTSHRPYLRYIKSLSSAWPSLRYLADWMEVTHAPMKWSLIKDKESVIRAERAKRTKVTILDFDQNSIISGNTPSRTFLSIGELGSELDTNPQPVDGSRLFIVEDLSRDVIELLGSRLDINPQFFRGHISDYSWYNTRDRWVELPELLRFANMKNFFTLRYVQPRYFRTRSSIEAATKQAALFNVLRRVDEDKNHTMLLDEDDAGVALVRSKMSFWFRAAEAGKHGFIGVLLVDPTIPDGFKIWCSQENFDSPPSMAVAGVPYSLPTSTFDNVIHWMEKLSNDDFSMSLSKPEVVAAVPAQLICLEWLRLCRYVHTRLEQIEWEVQHPDFRLNSNGIDSSLSRLHPWRRWVPAYKTMVSETINSLFHNCAPGDDNSLTKLQEDFDAVTKRLDELQCRIDRIVVLVTAVISIEESRRAITQNQYVGRLTYLAVIFAPLSFVSSFFSMTPDLSVLKNTIWVYFCVALPLSVIAFLLIDKERITRLLSRPKRKAWRS